MKYVQPQITNKLKADTAIQGLAKPGIHTDASMEPSAVAGYRADE